MAHRTAASPKETIEEGVENDHGMPASKKLQGERGGGAALKENVCQVDNVCPLAFSFHAYLFRDVLSNRLMTQS